MNETKKTYGQLVRENNALKVKFLELEKSIEQKSIPKNSAKNINEILSRERELYMDMINTQPAGIYRIRSILDKTINLNFQNSKVAPYTVDLISDRFCEILKLSKSDFEKNPAIIHDFVIEEDKNEFAQKNIEAFSKQIIFKWEGRLKIEDQIRWMHFESHPRMTNENEITWTGILYDITERKQVEEELEESKTFFEQLFIQSSTSTQLLDRDGWCVRINPKLSELFGVKPEHIEGKKYNILQDGEIIKTGVINHLKKVFENKETARWEVHFDIKHASESTNVEVSKPEKRWYSNLAYPILNNEGDLNYVIIQHEDITKRKQNEEKIKRYQENLEEIVRARTNDLETKNKELDKAMKVFVGRELTIQKLQERIKTLEMK